MVESHKNERAITQKFECLDKIKGPSKWHVITNLFDTSPPPPLPIKEGEEDEEE